MVPFIFKPVFVCIFTVHTDKNWLENERIHIQGRRKYLNMLLQWSRDFISEGEMEDPRRKRVTLLELLAAILLNWRK